MMRRTGRGILALGVVSFGLGLAPTGAKAQLFGGAPMPPSGGASLVGQQSTTNNGMMSMMANPYMNPLMNPFMNPYLTQSSTTTGNAAMYFFAMQGMNGGIGSGKLGGPRAQLNSTSRSTTSIADGERASGSNTPGATASRYFNRTTPSGTGLSRYYGRQNKQYPKPGR